MKDYYELKDITEALGVKRTKLQQWMAFGYVQPSIEQATGSGTRNKWSFADVIALAAFGELINMGLSRAAASKLVNRTETFTVETFNETEGPRVGKVGTDNQEFFADTGPDPFGERYHPYLVQFSMGEDSRECGVWDGVYEGLSSIDKVAKHLKIQWSNVIVLDVKQLTEKVKKAL